MTFSEDDPKVLLSLRQAEILKALDTDKTLLKKGGCTEGHHEVNGNEFVIPPANSRNAFALANRPKLETAAGVSPRIR